MQALAAGTMLPTQRHAQQARMLYPLGPTITEPARLSLVSVAIASMFCPIVFLMFAIQTNDVLHWFVIPVVLCGWILAIDMVDWFRGRIDAFDPVGVLGIIGIQFFMLASLTHVLLDIYLTPNYRLRPQDWRPWLGYLGCINLTGLLIYRGLRMITERRPRALIHPRNVWYVDKSRFRMIMPAALMFTGVLQVGSYAYFGGIAGFIETYEREGSGFAGMGLVWTFSESFAILAMMAYAVWARNRGKKITWTELIFVIGVFFVLKMLCGGLRGSRTNTMWGIVWAGGIIHFWLRPVPKKVIYSGLVFLLLFIYLYGFYKNVGRDALKAFESAEARAELTAQTGRGWTSVLLGDLGRSDIQSQFLWRYASPGYGDFTLWKGETYFFGAFCWVPRIVWPSRPDTKSIAVTEAMDGKGVYDRERKRSHFAIGMVGEAILNFGPLFAPLMFIPWSLYVILVRRCVHTWHRDDARRLFLPFLITQSANLMIGDTDTNAFGFVKNLSVPFLVVWMTTKRVPYDRYQWITAAKSLGRR
jgi:hypothetical protein